MRTSFFFVFLQELLFGIDKRRYKELLIDYIIWPSILSKSDHPLPSQRLW